MPAYFWNEQGSATWNDVGITYLNSAFTGVVQFDMQSGTPSDHLDFWSNYSGAWNSLASQQEAWGYVPSIAVPRTATFAATSNINVPTVGFALVGEVVFGLSAGQTSLGNTVYPVSVTLAVSDDISSVGNLIYVESLTFANTLNIPLPGTTTWDLETATWASAGESFGYSPTVTLSVAANINQVMLNELNAEDLTMKPTGLFSMSAGASASATVAVPVLATYAITANSSNTGLALMPQSITIASSESYSLAEDMAIPVSATFASSETFALAEDMLIPVEVTLAINNTQTGAANAIYVDSITVANEQNIKFNINFAESIGLAMTSNTSSINNFLWNDIAEDTGSTWTKVSDPDE